MTKNKKKNNAPKKNKQAFYTISVIAEMLDTHPQTLRKYEREGLIKPQRSEGKTRLYSDEDIKKIKRIFNLTRNLGVNLAGVEVILGMRRQIDELHASFESAVKSLFREFTGENPELKKRFRDIMKDCAAFKIFNIEDWEEIRSSGGSKKTENGRQED